LTRCGCASTDTARIAITLTGADEADTRAFFDTSAKAEAWESSLSSLSVFAFDNSGALIIRRDFTSSELASKSATFALPKSAAGTECSFYAVANYDASSAKTRAALTALVEKSAADYNGTFAEVSSAAKRSGGFVMSGSTSKTIGAVNSTTSVGITLKHLGAQRSRNDCLRITGLGSQSRFFISSHLANLIRDDVHNPAAAAVAPVPHL
jgi:hypothetical protein